MHMRRALIAGALVIVAAAVLLGTARRIAGPRNSMCINSDEFSEVMPGLRLHALPFWNLGADVRSNFFKSALYSRHGLGDTGFYYLASGALGLLHLPVSDRNLWLAGAITNGLLIVAIAWFAWRVAHSAAMAAAVMVMLALSPFYIFASQSGWARYSFVPLIQISTLNLAWLIARRPSLRLRIALAGLAFFLTLTDGFYFAPVLVLFIVLLPKGSLASRTGAALRDPTFWWTCTAIAAALAIDVAGATFAAAHDTFLTLFGYASAKSGYAGPPLSGLIEIWLVALQTFVPVLGVIAVVPAWLLACRYTAADPAAAALAAWFAITSLGVMRYFGSYWKLPPDIHSGIFLLSASPVALPSLLLVAWAFGRAFDAERHRLLRVATWVGCAVVTLALAVQVAAERYEPALTVKSPRYAALKDQCAVVKAASAYVRETGPPASTVMQLTTENQLGVMGEFYYGVSYVGNNKTGERNRLLDYGTLVYGRRYAPEELAALYGVPHFDYYVEFLTVNEPFTAASVARLERAGARPVLEVRDGGVAIGRVLSFAPLPAGTMDAAGIDARWNRVGHLSQLFRQSLAGTAFDFGYSWPPAPTEAASPRP
jgi:hypothetical protein